jgi:hypothetical protein
MKFPGTANPPFGLPTPHSAFRNPQSATPSGSVPSGAKFKNQQSHISNQQSGFVLILVLVLLALVTILVTVTTLMSRIERRSSWNAARIELARQNALFALDTALAQLQRAAGPDQRVTARADILGNSTNIAQPYWTGVWQTYDSQTAASGTGFQYLDGQTGGIAGSAMGTGTTGYNIRQWSTMGSPSTTGTVPLVTCANMIWLVSGGTNNTTINPSAASTSWTSNSVVLAKNLNAASAYSGSTGTLSVSVPLVPMMGTTVGSNALKTLGKYGYWVSDEGVKARVNLADPTYGVAAQTSGANFVQNQQHFLTPQANPVQNGLLGSANTTNDLRSTAVVPTSDFTKVTTLQSMGLTGSGVALTGMSGTGAAFFSPDATTYSRGVLADVCNGGLKLDLSQIFEDSKQFSAFLNSFTNNASPMLRLWQPVQPYWSTGDASVWSIITGSFDAGNDLTAAEFGPRWQSLYNYYCMYKSAIPSSVEFPGTAPWNDINFYSGNTPGTPSPTVDESVFNYSSIYNGANGTSPAQEVGEYYMPRILGFAVNFFMQAHQVTTSGSTYQMVVYAVPNVILYNPYDVTLNANNSQPYTFSLTTNLFGGGGTLVTTVSGANSSTSINYQYWSIKMTGPDAQTIENQKPITWNGMLTGTSSVTASGTTTTTGTYGGNSLTLVTGTNTFPFQPGEIKVYGLSGTAPPAQCGPGNLVVFDGKSPDRFIGGPGAPGNAQYQYVYADNSTNGTVWTGTCASPGSDTVTISLPGAAYGSNNGYYNLSTVPHFWPNTSGTSSGGSLGRFFNGSPTLTGSSVVLNFSSLLSSTIPNLSAATPIFQFVLRVKGMTLPPSVSGTSVANPTTPIFASSDGALNPLPHFFDDTIQDVFLGFTQSSNSTNEFQTGGPPNYDSYWGTQDAASNANDPSFLVLYDIPRQPMISLGQFMHMALRNSMAPSTVYAIDSNNSLWTVGGSLADPFFALNMTNDNSSNSYNGYAPNKTTNGGVACFDDNYLMNKALFDTYYFSTVPPPPSDMDSAYSTIMGAGLIGSGTTAFNASSIQNGTVVFPNARMRVYKKNGVAPTISSAQYTAGATTFPSYQMDSANLMMDGAFNVNSTSVLAWASLLSSLSGNQVNYLIPSSSGTAPSWSGSPLTSGALENPVFRLLSPVLSGSSAAVPSEINSYGNPSLWGCINALSNSQVLALATSIVNQVKQRGPFLSMADFINRRLDPPYFNNNSMGPTTGFGLKGALQAAIDNTVALTGTDLNNNQLTKYGATVTGTTAIRGTRAIDNNGCPSTASDLTTVSGSATSVLGAELRNTAEGAPGWLMQQDLVQCFSPVMTVRSDTFVVRCYGEADNQVTGATEGRAWCEAVVQRVPDYLDQTDTALTGANAYGTNLGDSTPPYDRVTSVMTSGTDSSATPTPIVDPANQTFGRRFKVIAFRWLNESDL